MDISKTNTRQVSKGACTIGKEIEVKAFEDRLEYAVCADRALPWYKAIGVVIGAMFAAFHHGRLMFLLIVLTVMGIAHFVFDINAKGPEEDQTLVVIMVLSAMALGLLSGLYLLVRYIRQGWHEKRRRYNCQVFSVTKDALVTGDFEALFFGKKSYPRNGFEKLSVALRPSSKRVIDGSGRADYALVLGAGEQEAVLANGMTLEQAENLYAVVLDNGATG